MTRKEVGRWSEAGRRVSLGLFCPNTVEARDIVEGLLRALPKAYSLVALSERVCEWQLLDCLSGSIFALTLEKNSKLFSLIFWQNYLMASTFADERFAISNCSFAVNLFFFFCHFDCFLSLVFCSSLWNNLFLFHSGLGVLLQPENVYLPLILRNS